MIALSLSELQSNKILLRQEFAENLPAVKGDRIQIQQVILNLVRNASDAMRDVDDRPRQLLIKTESGDSKNRPVHRAGHRYWFRSECRRSALRLVLYNQERRHGDWAFDQPFDY